MAGRKRAAPAERKGSAKAAKQNSANDADSGDAAALMRLATSPVSERKRGAAMGSESRKVGGFYEGQLTVLAGAFLFFMC